VKKDRFGKSKGPLSKAEIEREAQRELERLSRGAGPRPTFTPPSGPPTALDEVADSMRGRSAAVSQPFRPPAPDLGAGPVGMPQFGGVPGRRGAPPPSLEPDAPFYDDDEAAADEAANVTEIALRDHAARFGSDPEDLVIRQDPFAAEMMRDQAMRQFIEKQEATQHKTSRRAPADPVTSVLNRLAARKKAEEEILAQGDDGSGQSVLDRIRARREALVAEVDPPPPSPLRGGPSRGGQARGRSRMATIDEDDEDDDDSPLAAMRARAEARRPPRPAPPARVVALPGTELGDDDDLDDDQDGPLEADFEFEDEDEAVEENDQLDEYDELAGDDEVEAPSTPSFEDVVSRLSRVSPPKPAPATKGGARVPASRPAARSARPAPKPKAKSAAVKVRAAKSGAAKSATAKSGAAKSATAKSGAAKVPSAKTSAAKTPAAKAPATKVQAAKTSAAKTSAHRVGVAEAPTARKSVTDAAAKSATKAPSPRGGPKAAPVPRTPRVDTARMAPPKRAAEAAPAQTPEVSDAAARKAAAKAKIAAAAKRVQSTR